MSAQEDYPDKPQSFLKPVTWLLGSNLLRETVFIALYAAFGRRLGGIDWMSAEPSREDLSHADDTEIWFDYIADSGDSQMATYSLAYLCMSDLRVDEAKVGAEARFDEGPSPAGEASRLLPRGRFLFVGGDTAYHVANVRTLLQRFRNPFCWAYADLKKNGRPSAEREGRIYAIPGNHDYYDSLQGFNHQFRKPTEETSQRLRIPSFTRAQNASYVAIKLPFDWWLFGLDAQNGEIDHRQRTFFKGIIPEQGLEKLILATPEPTTSFGLRCRRNAAIVRTQQDLGLDTPFLDETPHLEKARCRLDLAGDIHHYARYWGTEQSPHYASVVSGLGGTFLHPSHTDFGEVPAERKYPDPEVSRVETNRRLFNPWLIVTGGNVPVMGLLLGLILTFAWQHEGTSGFLAALVSGFRQIARGALPAAFFSGASDGALSLLAGLFFVWLSRREFSRYRAQIPKQGEGLSRPVLAYIALLFLALSPLIHSDFIRKLLHWKPAPTGVLLESALLFQFAIIGTGMILSTLWHRELLDERAKKRRGVEWWDDLLGFLIAVLGLVTIVAAVGINGGQKASTLALHLAFLSLGPFTMLVLTIGAARVCGHGRGPWTKAGFGLLGAWHGALHIGIPLLWAAQGASIGMLLHVPLLAVANVIGFLCATRGDEKVTRWLLALCWFIVGAANLALPILWSGGLPDRPAELAGFWPPLAHGLVVALAAGALSCVWAGWYFAVSLAFGGHNNEAGGAARIEEYKEFMRIRLTDKGLTAYVIGIDKPAYDGASLKPRIVDMFELTVKESAPTASAPPAQGG